MAIKKTDNRIEEEMVFVLKVTAVESNINILNELLAGGWYVKSVTPMGMSSGPNQFPTGMAVFVLRKLNI